MQMFYIIRNSGRCGNITRTKLKVYSCDVCGLVIDRDTTG